ncbi:hypothetical protein BV898_06451 [Hypsibius exemplaris]|uniref:Uncharacterized protein n=1 Tax=Hypsibius exemplaris TaxID=2072580 RepID=A0A1W0WW85_HYPEX|nr:hypothetical protein BV898_06451 [Hypsibius exemplaris]
MGRKDDIPEQKEPFADKFYKKPDFQRVIIKSTGLHHPSPISHQHQHHLHPRSATLSRHLYCECVVCKPQHRMPTEICIEPFDTTHSPRRERHQRNNPSSRSTSKIVVSVTSHLPVVPATHYEPTNQEVLRQLLAVGDRKRRIWDGQHDAWKRRMDLTSRMKGFEVHRKKERYANFLPRENALVKEVEYGGGEAGWNALRMEQPREKERGNELIGNGIIQPSRLGPRTLFEFSKEIGYNWSQLECIIDVISGKSKFPAKGTVKHQPVNSVVGHAYGQHIRIREKKLGIQHPIINVVSESGNRSLTGPRYLRVTYSFLTPLPDRPNRLQLSGHQIAPTAVIRRVCAKSPRSICGTEIRERIYHQ